MPYRIDLDGSAAGGEEVRIDLFPDDHDLLADAIMRGAGGVRLLRRLVDPAGDADFAAGEVVQVLHEIETLRDGLDEIEPQVVGRYLDRLQSLFGEARRRGVAVLGRAQQKGRNSWA